jgi:serine/threonine protein kinase
VAFYDASTSLLPVANYNNRFLELCTPQQIIIAPPPLDYLVLSCSSINQLVLIKNPDLFGTPNVSYVNVALPQGIHIYGMLLVNTSLYISTLDTNQIFVGDIRAILNNPTILKNATSFTSIFTLLADQQPTGSIPSYYYGGMTLDDSGRVAVATAIYSQVWIVNGISTLTPFIGAGSENSLLIAPHDVKRGFSKRHYFVPDSVLNQVLEFDTDGSFVRVFLNGSNHGDTFSAPLFLDFFPCPNVTAPPVIIRSSTTSSLNTIIPAVVVPVAVLFALLCCAFMALYFGFKLYGMKRKRYYDGEKDDRYENMLTNSSGRKYVYREIDPADLKCEQLLGKGAFGKVYKGEYRGAPVAIKTFENIDLNQVDEKLLDEIRQEAELMEKLGNHPNVVGFVGAITKRHDEDDIENQGNGKKENETDSESDHSDSDDNENGKEEKSVNSRPLKFNHFALVLKFCPKGSLYDLLITKRKKLPWVTIVGMARDAAAGILHLHREHVIHRDIAARNCLVGENYNVFISDFGLARVKEDDVGQTQSNIGPVKWMAPEAITRRQYSEASDAFSYGVLLWEMTTRRIPWSGLNAAQVMIAVTQQNTRLKIPANCDPVFRMIMKSVWQENPAKRMKFETILKKLTSYHETLKQYVEQSSEDEISDASDRNDETSFPTSDASKSLLSTQDLTHQIDSDNAIEMRQMETKTQNQNKPKDKKKKTPGKKRTSTQDDETNGSSLIAYQVPHLRSSPGHTATASGSSMSNQAPPSIIESYQLPSSAGSSAASLVSTQADTPSTISVVGYTLPRSSTSTSASASASAASSATRLEADSPSTISVVGYTLPSSSTSAPSSSSSPSTKKNNTGTAKANPDSESSSIIGYTLPSSSS